MSKSSKANAQAQTTVSAETEALRAQIDAQNEIAAESVKAEQAAALAKMRREKEIAEALAKTEQPKIEIPEFVADSVAPSLLSAENMADAVKQMLDRLGLSGEGPSMKRKLAALFATIILSAGAGYAIGSIASYIIIGIATLGGSILWAYLTLVIALLLAFYAGAKIGQHVGNYILSGQIDRDVIKVKNKVTGWFKSKPLVVAA